MKDLEALLRYAARNKYVLLVLALGLVLLLLPKSGGSAAGGPAAEGAALPLAASGIPMDVEERRLAGALSRMGNVGEAEVLLSMEGAIVICEGADDPTVRLEVTDAVSLYTGLGRNRIQVMKRKP